MLTLPNFLSLLRIPLALLFLTASPILRLAALFLAMLSDGLDGYIARKYKHSSRLGALLDPISDKFFVFFVLAIFIQEHKLEWWQMAAMMCRDFSVIFFGFYLIIRNKLLDYQFGAIWSGKIATTVQFFVLTCLAAQIKIPYEFYFIFIILGIAAFVELYVTRKALLHEDTCAPSSLK